MAYQMAATAVTLNDFGGQSPVAGLYTCKPLNICTAFYTISTDSVLFVSCVSCMNRETRGKKIVYARNTGSGQ